MAPTQEHSGSEQNATLGVSGVVIGFAVVSVALRFYTRIFTKAGLKADDWFIMAAVIATLATAALLLWGNAVDPDGLWVSENTDPTYIYTSQDIFYLKLAFVTSVLYFTIAGATKLGILLMYLRIFNISQSFRYQLFIASGMVIGWWIGCTVSTLTNCIPLEWSWINSFADPQYCFNYNIFWMASGACEIILDVLILTLPVSVVVRMRFSTKRKLTVLGIFLLGGFTIITGLVRVILGYPKGSRVPSYSNTEVWTTVHAGMSIVCASLPIFRPLLKRITGSSLVTRLSSFQVSSLSHISTSQSTSQSTGQSTQQSSVEAKPDVSTDSHETSQGRNWQLPPVQADETGRSLSAQWMEYLGLNKASTKHSSMVIEQV